LTRNICKKPPNFSKHSVLGLKTELVNGALFQGRTKCIAVECRFFLSFTLVTINIFWQTPTTSSEYRDGHKSRF